MCFSPLGDTGSTSNYASSSAPAEAPAGAEDMVSEDSVQPLSAVEKCHLTGLKTQYFRHFCMVCQGSTDLNDKAFKLPKCPRIQSVSSGWGFLT